jgi:hypothetical protein
MKSPIERVNGASSWEHQEGDRYLVTGTCRDGKKFSYTYSKLLKIFAHVIAAAIAGTVLVSIGLGLGLMFIFNFM